MRTLHLYCDRANGGFVSGLGSAAPVTSLRIVQEDALQIICHSARRNTASPAVTPFVEDALDFAAIRASIGRIDAAPGSGTFRLRTGGETTAPIAWPESFADAAAIAAWKAGVIAAMETLTVVEAGDLKLDDPADTPAHFSYLTWTDPDRDDAIEVVENRLVPLTSATVRPAPTPGGFTQLLKLVRQPLAVAGEFSRPQPPAITVLETRPGGDGANAEQTLIVPPGAMGGVSLRWNGASSRVMGVANLTAAQIASALNELVEGADSNPAFAVTDRATNSGRRFAVELTGALAGEAQALLAVTMSDQIALSHATGILDLSESALPVEQALNGALSALLTFELVISTADGEETYLIPVTVVNDMTSGATTSELEAAGAVLVRERVVYVNADPQPFFEVAPGVSYVPAVAAEAFVVAHNLNTWFPHVRVAHRTGDDPEVWEQLPDNEYHAEAISADTVRVTMPVELSEDPEDPDYAGNFKIFIASPDATVTVFAHEHDYDGVRESLPDGPTLRDKLAAIDAALGIVGGSLKINASQILGMLKASQIDLSSLSGGLLVTGQFLETLRTLVSDSVIINRIGEGLATSEEFHTTLETLLAEETVLTLLIESLGDNSDFNALVRRGVLDVIQQGALPEGFILMEIADIEREIAPLHPATTVTLNKGNITGGVERAATANAGWKYTVVGRASTSYRDASGLVRQRFAEGDVIVSTGARWFIAREEGSYAYPRELEIELFTLHVNAAMFVEGTRFATKFSFALELLEAVGAGQCVFELRLGTPAAEAGKPANIQAVTWLGAAVIEQPLVIADARVHHTFGYAVSWLEGEAKAAERTLYSRTTDGALLPAAADFVLQARLIRVDVENDPLVPVGSLRVSMQDAAASVVTL